MRQQRVVIVGGRKKAHFLTKSFIKKNLNVTIINDSEAFCEELVHEFPTATIACADGTKPYIFEDLNIESSDYLIALMPSDADNLIASQIAKYQFKVKKVFCTVNNPINVEMFKKLGVSNVISSTYIVSNMIEQLVILEKIENYIPIEAGKIGLFEVMISASAQVCSQPIMSIDLPKQAIVACIIRHGESIIPKGDTILMSNDKCIVLTTESDKANTIQKLTQVKIT
ncbi:MAG: NAD-binding protein [Erysipelotrichia bacterium]|jgi:trk system potassium uptake protein TrkA|nr:NAD-binding protein [Erysipelotrichia bacterium]